VVVFVLVDVPLVVLIVLFVVLVVFVLVDMLVVLLVVVVMHVPTSALIQPSRYSQLSHSSSCTAVQLRATQSVALQFSHPRP
jgi:hypothetical protein